MSTDRGYYYCTNCKYTAPNLSSINMEHHNGAGPIKIAKLIGIITFIASVFTGVYILTEIKSNDWFGTGLGIGIIIQGTLMCALIFIFTSVSQNIFDIKMLLKERDEKHAK